MTPGGNWPEMCREQGGCGRGKAPEPPRADENWAGIVDSKRQLLTIMLVAHPLWAHAHGRNSPGNQVKKSEKPPRKKMHEKHSCFCRESVENL